MSIEEIRNRREVESAMDVNDQYSEWSQPALAARLRQSNRDRAELLRVIDAVDAFIDELSNDEAANVQEGGVPSRMSLHIANRLQAILRGEETND